MNENYILKKIESINKQINQQKDIFTAYKNLNSDFINDFVKPIFIELKEQFFLKYNMPCQIECKDDQITFLIYQSKEEIFKYKLRVLSKEQIIVYSSNIDPDMDAFKPKDIFGDYQKLDINNISQENIIDDLLEKYKSSEIFKIKSNDN